MADNAGGGSNTFLGFMVGGLLVLVAALGFFMYTGGHLGNAPSHTVNLNVKTDKPGG